MNQPPALPRSDADGGQPKRKFWRVGRGCPGETRRRTRSRASDGAPRETQRAAPPANARQSNPASQPAGCPAFPVCPQKSLGAVRSRCPFVGTARFIFAIPVAPDSDVPVRNHKNTSLKLDWCQSQDWRMPITDYQLPIANSGRLARWSSKSAIGNWQSAILWCCMLRKTVARIRH